MTALMILAVFFPALAGVLVWCLPAAKEDRALRAKLNCGALALERLRCKIEGPVRVYDPVGNCIALGTPTDGELKMTCLLHI